MHHSACPEMSSSPSCFFENVGFIIIPVCEANRSGDDCHRKDRYYSCQEQGACHTMQGHERQHQGLSRGRGSEEETWARDSFVVYVGRNRQGKQTEDCLV